MKYLQNCFENKNHKNEINFLVYTFRSDLIKKIKKIKKLLKICCKENDFILLYKYKKKKTFKRDNKENIRRRKRTRFRTD